MDGVLYLEVPLYMVWSLSYPLRGGGMGGLRGECTGLGRSSGGGVAFGEGRMVR